ncbi:SHOCT domain-containing protein [Agromyces laixinhei]|uniref:SHOCT domain-containing protein n=1 Tax=Agromyces laixinhei TaxID=2585717 RepID=UPI001E5C56C3|nr:SHOCT domain-containing protein [Agromyces laixinhei]
MTNDGAEAKAEGAFSKLKRVAADKQAAKRSEKAELDRKNAETVQAAGMLVTSGIFGTSTVEIYEGGYVRVAAGAKNMTAAASITRKTPYEKLRSIKYSQPAKDKVPAGPSGLEGAVSSAVTTLIKGGTGLMKASVPGLAVAGVTHLAGVEGRRAYLTITTDKAIHTLTNESSNGYITKTNKGHNEVGAELEATGMSVLGIVDVATLEAQPAPDLESGSEPRLAAASQTTAGPTLAERLREMAGLHRDGILSDEEFANAKAKLLGGL